MKKCCQKCRAKAWEKNHNLGLGNRLEREAVLLKKSGALRAASVAVDQATISVVAAWPMVPTAKSTAPRPVRSTIRLVWSVSA